MAREARKPSPGLALIEVAASLNAGDTVHLDYRRETNRKSAILVLAPASDFNDATFRNSDVVVSQRWRGDLMPPDVAVIGGDEPELFLPFKTMADLELAPMNPGLGQYFGVSTGVLVIHAPEGTPLNLKSGDVVTLIDGRRVSSPNQFFRVIRSYETGEQFRIEIMRMKRRETVTASIAER
jgi:PDZ domain-containing secreted protein